MHSDEKNLIVSIIALKDLLIEGISQCGVDSRLPLVSTEKRLKVFLEDRLSNVCPTHSHRIIAHPDMSSSNQLSTQLNDIKSSEHVTVAIGPEDGWTDREVQMLQNTFGFQGVSLGSRILRTDAAVLVLLGLIQATLSQKPTD